MKSSHKLRAVGVGLACTAIGAASGIAGSTAATSGHKTKAHATNTATGQPEGPGRRGPGHGRGVHSNSVVLNQAGTAFETVTEDSGAFKSLSGDQLTITEGTKTVTYKDVTLTIPAGATVYRNGAKAALTDLASGDQVHVNQAPEGTVVLAEDAAHQAAHDSHGADGPGGRGPRGGPPGPPPSMG